MGFWFCYLLLCLFLSWDSERLKNHTATTVTTSEKSSFLSFIHLCSIISCYFQSLWSWSVPRGSREKMDRKFHFDRYCYKLASHSLGLFFFLSPAQSFPAGSFWQQIYWCGQWILCILSPLSLVFSLPLYKLSLLDSHSPLKLCSWQESKRLILSLSRLMSEETLILRPNKP